MRHSKPHTKNQYKRFETVCCVAHPWRECAYAADTHCMTATNNDEINQMTVRNSIVGCLLAGALGDSVGAYCENQPNPQFKLDINLRVTDDTQLTIATCESIIRSSSVEPESIAQRMTDWFRERRITGIGASTLKSLTELNAGGHWATVGATGERSAGNGAAMRIAPLAFFLDPCDDWDRTTIRDVCRITHRNDEAYLGALAILYSINRNQLDHELVEYLIDKLPDSRIRDRFVEVDTQKLTTAKLASRYKPSGYVVDSVPVAILSAIESDNLLNTIKSIVEFGGDTDTIASMFGHIFGAIHGTESLPMDIVEKIDEFELVLRTAAQLYQTTADQ